MVRALQIVAVLAAVVSAGAGAYWGLWQSELLRYRTLRVVGLERATEAQIRHLADLDAGAPLVALDLDAAAAGVARHPWVASAQVRRVFPDTVVVQVREREPVAILQLDGLFLVDAEGTPFTRATGADLDLPLLTGIPRALADREPELGRRLLREGLARLDAVQTRGGLAPEAISEVRFDARAGYTVTLRNGGEVRLGFASLDALDRLPALAAAGVDLSTPHRLDLGLRSLAVVSPL